MKEQLEIKDLAQYLPYGLKYKVFGKDYPIQTLKPGNITDVDGQSMKPIMYPLSMLTQEIEHNGERFVPIDRFVNLGFVSYTETLIHRISLQVASYRLVKKLHEWHFDTNGLIERGLAIDKRTV